MGDRLKEQLAICDAATEGPWEDGILDDGLGVFTAADNYPGVLLVANIGGIGEERADDATFIATARTALPDALKALVKCREVFEKIIPMVDREGKSAKLAREALAAIEQVGGGDDEA